MLESEFADAIAIGRSNVQVIELVRRHCAHASVERPPIGGRGLLEAETGLPIDMRTVRCPHAASPAPSGMRLDEIAFMFWRANCRGCEHREVRDIPNLATAGEASLAAEAARTATEAAAVAERDRLRQERANERATRVASEPQSVRDLVALIDGVDAERPDGRAKVLVDLVRAAPERCSELAGRILVDTALVVQSDALLEVLDCLERADKVPADRILVAALWQLEQRPSRAAAAILIRLRNGLGSGDLTPVMAHLVWLSGRPIEPFDRSSPYVEAISLAADLDLPAVLDEIRDGMDDPDNESRRGRWAFAAAELMTIRPETAGVLAESVARSLMLPGSDSLYAGSPHSGIHAALVAALAARPVEVDAVFERVAPSLNEAARKSIFHAYTTVLWDPRSDRAELSDSDTAVLVNAVFARLNGSWGAEVLTAAVDALDSISRHDPNLLADPVDAVFGVLLELIAEPTMAETGSAGLL